MNHLPLLFPQFSTLTLILALETFLSFIQNHLNTHDLSHLHLKTFFLLPLILHNYFDFRLALKHVSLFTHIHNLLFLGDQESISSFSALNISELPNHSLDKKHRALTLDPLHYRLIPDNERFNLPRQNLRYHILPVNRKNKGRQYSILTRKRQVKSLSKTTTEGKFDVTVKFIRIKPHSIPISTRSEHRTFPRRFLVTWLQFTFTDEPPFHHQWGSIIFTTPTLV